MSLDVLGLGWSGGEKKLMDVFGYRGGPFYEFGGKIAIFEVYFWYIFGLNFCLLFWMIKFLYFYSCMNIFLCTYTGKWSKIAIFWSKKGSPSEDVASNADIHTTNAETV